MKRRLFRTAPVLLPLGMLLLGALQVRGRFANANQQLRKLLIVEFTRALQVPVEIGRVHGTLSGDVRLEDLVVGRDPALPGGAVFRARNVVFGLNTREYLRGTIAPAQLITRVELDRPELLVTHSRDGYWNLQRWLRRQPGPRTPFRFHGRVLVRGGRLHYHDEFVALRAGAPLRLTATEVTGWAEFAGEAPVRFAATLRGGERFERVSARGQLPIQGGGVAVTAQASNADAAYFLSRFLPNPDYRLESGRADADLLLAYGSLPAGQPRFNFSGALQLRGVRAFARPLAPQFIEEINGPVSVAGRLVSLRGVQARLGTSRATVTGTFLALPGEPQFDLEFESPHADVRELAALTHRRSPGADRAARLVGPAVAAGRVRVSGNRADVVLSGEARLGATTVEHPDYGVLVSSPFTLRFDTPSYRQARTTAELIDAQFDLSAMTPGNVSPHFSRLQVTQLASARLHLSGFPEQPVLRGELRTPQLRVGGALLTDCAAQAEYRQGFIRLSQVRAGLGGGELRGEAQLRLDGERPLVAVRSRFERVDFRSTTPALREAVSALGAADGEFTAHGTPGELAVEMTAHASHASLRWRDGERTQELPMTEPRWELVGDYTQSDASRWKFVGTTRTRAELVQLPIASPPTGSVQSLAARAVRFEGACALESTGAETLPLALLDGRLVAEQVEAVLPARADRPGPTVRATSVDTELALTSESFVLANLRARVLGAAVRLQFSLPRGGGELRGRFSGEDVDLARLAEVAGRDGWSGRAQVSGEVSGTLAAPVIHSELEALALQVPGLQLPLRHVSARSTWAGAQVAVEEAIAWHRGMRLSLHGQLDEIDAATGDARLRLAVELTGGDVRTLLQLAGNEEDADGVVAARASVTGTVKQPIAQGTLELARGRLRTLVFDRGAAEVSLHHGRWELPTVSAQFGDAHLEGSGTYAPATGVNGRWSLVNAPAGLVAQWLGLKTRVTGRMAASGTLQGSFPQETLAGGVTISDLRIEKKRFGDLRLAGSLQRARATIQQATLVENSYQRALSGVIPFQSKDPSLALNLQLTRESLAELVANVASLEQALAREQVETEAMRTLLSAFRSLPPPVSGEVSMEAVLTGSGEQPRLVVRGLRLNHPTIGGEALPSVKEAGFRWDGHRLVVDTFLAESGDQRLEVREGSQWSREELDLKVTASNISLRTLRPWLGLDRTVDGKLAVTLAAQGPVRAPELQATVEATELRTRPWPLERVRARLEVGGGELRVSDSELVLRGRGDAESGRNLVSVTGTVPVRRDLLALDRDRKLDLRVQARPQEFALDPIAFPHLSDAHGRVEGALAITGTLNRPQLDGGVTLSDTQVKLRAFPGEIQELTALVRLTVDEAGRNRISLDRAAGQWRLGKPATRSLREPSALNLFVAGEESRAAPIDEWGRFEVAGHAQLDTGRLLDWRAHQYDLRLQLSGGSWSAPRFSGLHQIGGELAFLTGDATHRMTIAGLSVRDGAGAMSERGIGKGRMTVAGTVDFARTLNGNGSANGSVSANAWRGIRVNLSGEAQQFYLRFAPSLRGLLVGTVTLRNEEDAAVPLLRGKLDVPTATLAGFSQSEAPTPRLPAWPRLDLTIVLGKEVQVRTAAFEAQVEGGGTVRGTPAQPEATFNFVARHGLVRFPGATLRVTHGTTSASILRDDRGNLSPQLNVNLRAQGQLERSRVTLAVQGPVALDARRAVPFELLEEPPTMSKEALYTRLLGLPAQEPGRSGEPREQIAGEHVLAIFQAPLVSGLTGEFRRAFGLQVLDLDYRPGNPTAVRFGKELTNNIFVIYRRQVSGTTQTHTLRLEYRIRGRILLGYQTDEREQIISLDAAFRF